MKDCWICLITPNDNDHNICNECINPFLREFVISGAKCGCGCGDVINGKMLVERGNDETLKDCFHIIISSLSSKETEFVKRAASDVLDGKSIKNILIDYYEWMQCHADQKLRIELEDLLLNKCPKCFKVFFDYDACHALACSCGCYYCGICFGTFATSQLCHSHCQIKHGNMFIPEDQAAPIKKWYLLERISSFVADKDRKKCLSVLQPIAQEVLPIHWQRHLLENTMPAEPPLYRNGPLAEPIELPRPPLPIPDPPPPARPEPAPQCNGIKKDGHRCNNAKLNGSDYCGTHGGRVSRCEALKIDKNRCTNTSKYGKFCGTHRNWDTRHPRLIWVK